MATIPTMSDDSKTNRGVIMNFRCTPDERNKIVGMSVIQCGPRQLSKFIRRTLLDQIDQTMIYAMPDLGEDEDAT